jgi:phosphatidylethanolamine-binding protein (PEBP) family uncharacterized protein
MKRSIAVLAMAGVSAVASLLAVTMARAADVFTLTSPAIQDNGTLATKNACSDKQRSPNCVGENISPPLAWSNAPDGTKSFALLLFDPEGRAPAGVSHMSIRSTTPTSASSILVCPPISRATTPISCTSSVL